MGILSFLRRQPRAASQSDGPGRRITSAEDIEAAIRAGGIQNSAGIPVTPDSAMRVAAVFACVRLISGAVANMPVQVKRRIDADTREDLSDSVIWELLRRKPNSWQTPSQFKRMLTAHILLRGNAYARIVWSRGNPIGLIPLNPDRMDPKQDDRLVVQYHYRRRDGGKITFAARDILHLTGLTLDGVTGVSAITYARETIGMSIAQEQHGAKTFRNAARPSSVLTHPNTLGREGTENLRASLDEYRSGGESEGRSLILEEGMDIKSIAMTSQDAQWIESRKFSRGDIAMFFGVPPHMIGDTEKTTSWGSGIEAQSTGFVTYTLEDHLTAWEECLARDLELPRDVYVRFQRNALVRGDLKTRTDHYVRMTQWGIYSPNDVRRMEDQNPRDGGDVYYPPPNTAGTDENEGTDNEPTQTA